MEDLVRKKALITGASRGIGRATAARFARGGYDLVLNCAHSIETLEAFGRELMEQWDILVTVVPGDVGKYDDVCRLFADLCHLEVLVNNAGVSYIGLLSEMSPEDWRMVLGTNLDSCFYTSRLAVPLMLKKHRGSIVNVSSVWGNVGASMEVAYSASKGAVNAFTKALAKELAPSGIQVNAVACGLIDTEMNGHLSAEDLEALREEIPADRMGTPEEVAEVIWQTAHAPAYLTGQVITVDGGWC